MSSTEQTPDSSPDNTGGDLSSAEPVKTEIVNTEEAPEKQVEEVTETKPESAPNKTRAVKKTGNRKSFTGALFFIMILLVLGAAAAGYYYWQQLQLTLQTMQATATEQATQIDSLSAQIGQASAGSQKNAQALTQLAQQLEQKSRTIAELSETQQTLITTSQNVFNLTHRNQRQWILAETSYLLSLASQRLIIVSDVSSAIKALTAANHRLHDLADPSLLPLRKQIAADITALKMVHLPDINGIALSLENMTHEIAQLPFKSVRDTLQQSSEQQSETISIPVPEGRSVFTKLLERLNKLVTIRKHSADIRQTQSVADKTEIDQQLQYRLETARLALVNKNSQVFNNEIASALQLLTLYYDAADNRVQTMQSELSNYASLSLVPELPDISKSWILLQQVIAAIEANDSLQPNEAKKAK